jgi:hypothetical protein
MVMSPQNVKVMGVILNEEECNKYTLATQERWNQFLLG